MRDHGSYRASSSFGLLLIAVFKLFKGLLLIAVGVGALRLLHKDVAETALHWIKVLRVDPDNRFIHSLLVRLVSVDKRKLKEVSAGTFLYAAIFLTEGFGLLRHQLWAEYFTIIATGALIPVEMYETFSHASAAKLLVIAINIAVVWYLIARLVRDRRGNKESGARRRE